MLLSFSKIDVIVAFASSVMSSFDIYSIAVMCIAMCLQSELCVSALERYNGSHFVVVYIAFLQHCRLLHIHRRAGDVFAGFLDDRVNHAFCLSFHFLHAFRERLGQRGRESRAVVKSSFLATKSVSQWSVTAIRISCRRLLTMTRPSSAARSAFLRARYLSWFFFNSRERLFSCQTFGFFESFACIAWL